MRGTYRHFKGGMYEVLGVALDSETKEHVVVYKALEDSADIKKGTLWVRPQKMFEEIVERDGVRVPRFKKVE